MPATEIPDYYELLEISPQATQETIHRVYRFLAARYHPDHSDTGDLEKFTQITAAYKILSEPARRAEYNGQRALRQVTYPHPMSCTVDFMDQTQGDLNRRLAVLAILYYRRRMYPDSPEVELAEIEQRMGFPRDYLEFTTWYLGKKKYITRADNAEFTLTVDGVDFIESQRAAVPLLARLLTSGTGAADADTPGRISDSASAENPASWEYPIEVSPAAMTAQL
jgi:curved DNA-binding protein CbpA